MKSAKIDFLSKYNDLINSALSSSTEFPNDLCEFLIKEYEFEAVVLTTLINSGFEILGKSGNANKSYSTGMMVQCNDCISSGNESTNIEFIAKTDCDLRASEIVMNEGCLNIGISDNEKVMLKIAKKTEFTQSEIDDMSVIGGSLKNLLRLWVGKKGSLSSSISNIISSIAHELRTPTNSIMGFASLLNEENLS